jgi:uncharacterized membrane protein YccC
VFQINWKNLNFSTATFGAAMLALYLSMCIDLQQPYWAMMTVYIVSQPLAAAVRSKALQRLLGTLLGACAAVVMVQNLVNTPVLLSLAMAFWVGGCLAISLLDRSPRSYIMMLAGYTAAIIGFSSVNQPGEIFTLAVARSEEIVLGIICATVVHSLWFPRPVSEALRTRIQNWLGEADRWALDILHSDNPAALVKDRARLAAAASEIHIMATHLPFDTSHLRETTAVVHALHDRILMLIPILSSMSDRLAAMRSERSSLDAQSLDAITMVSEWINAKNSTGTSSLLIEKLDSMSAVTSRSDWYSLNQLGLFARLQDLVKALDEGHALLVHLNDAQSSLPPALSEIVVKADERPMHSDPGLALLSGAAATISILITCAVWIGFGWTEGGASAMLAAILSCLFAAMDDPTPAMKTFGISLLIAVPLAAIYLFIILPAIDSFPMLVIALAPTMLTVGVVMLNPHRALLSLVTLLNFCNAMAIQERMSTDFARFLNLNLSMFFGVFTAIFITRTLRSMSTDASARRLLHHTWKSLAQLAHGNSEEKPAAFASHMVDRLGLLVPRLSASKDEALSGIDALNELRVGMDLVALQNIRGQLPTPEKVLVDQLLQAIGKHYAARTAGAAADDGQLLPTLDRALHTLSSSLPASGVRALTALVGLRRNLFPQARFVSSLAGGIAR